MYGGLIFLFHAAMGGVTQSMAEKRGKSKNWFWVGLIFGIMGPVIFLALQGNEDRKIVNGVGINVNVPEKTIRNLKSIRGRTDRTFRAGNLEKNEMVSDPKGCDILEQYRRLLENDVITSSEYEAKKKKIREQEEWNQKLSRL